MTGQPHLCRVLTAALLLIISPPAAAKDALPLQPARIAADNFVAEAAQRFGIPTRWIWAVMRAESGGLVRATSPSGAMGLMQIMPATWEQLRERHGLGNDPYDLRDNILAGAAYLRAMHDRYGVTGMLAAYNAGPGRYEDYLLRARPLPQETLDYVARLTQQIGISTTAQNTSALPLPTAQWTQAALFAVRAETPNTPIQATADHTTDAQIDRGSTVQLHPGLNPMNSIATGLFVPLSGSNRP
jgi:hypothetical protein